MTLLPTALPLLVLVAAVWLGALACWRLGRALDRLHAVSFVNLVGGAGLTLACFAAEGASLRALKVLALWLLLVLSGAVLSHAIGRGLLVRDGRGA